MRADRQHSLRLRAPALAAHQRKVRKGYPDGLMPAWADLESMNEVYKEAKRLTEETGVPHHVDHVVPLKGRRKGELVQTVTGLHVPWNLRVRAAGGNMSKWCWYDGGDD